MRGLPPSSSSDSDASVYYEESRDFLVDLTALGFSFVALLAAIGSWLANLVNKGPVILTLILFIATAYLWNNQHDSLLESGELFHRCYASPFYADTIETLLKIVQRIFNPTICGYNAVNYITYGVWRNVLYPLARKCNIGTIFLNIGKLFETFANDFVADYLASGRFLLPAPAGLFNWGPGSDPYNQPNGQAPGGSGLLCQRWVDLWDSWVDLYSCLCNDLSKFLRLQPLFVIIGFPPIPAVGFPGFFFASMWPPGLISSDQIGDFQLWRAVGHAFNAVLNIFQQLWAILLYVIVFLFSGGVPPGEFPRLELGTFVQLLCLSSSAFVRSCENAAQLFVECFLPFPFDFRFFFCWIDAAICVALKLVAWLVGILFNADRLGTQCLYPTTMDTDGECCPLGVGKDPLTGKCLGTTTPAVEGLWSTRFRDEWKEIANRIAPVYLPGWFLPNEVGKGGPIEGVPRLSECISIFLQRLLCDPAQVCFDENAQPTPCLCYGHPVPENVLGEFSLSCIIEAALTLIVDLLTALLDATYNFDNALTYFLWVDDKWFSYLDVILIDDLVSEDVVGGRNPGVVRCILSLFRVIPTVGGCVESLLVDFASRVIAAFTVFLVKYLTSSLVLNLVFFLVGPLSGPQGACLADPPAQPEFNCVNCAASQIPSASSPCFPRGWLLTPNRSRADWERIWKPIIVQETGTLEENRRSAENCFCQLLNLIPIPRLPCTNCEPCGFIPASGPFIPCKRSPYEDVDRMCNDPLTGPYPGQGIIRDRKNPARKRVDEIRLALQEARRSVPKGHSPTDMFQRLRQNSRAASQNQRMISKRRAEELIRERRQHMMSVLHASHARESPLKEPMEGWTRNFLRDMADPAADLSGYAPEGVHVRRFDQHLVDRALGDDGHMWGLDPETGKRHRVDERIICTSPEGGVPGCFDLCCYFRRSLRFIVRLLIQTGDFFDGIFFGSEETPRWQYFVGPESELFLAKFELDLLGLAVEGFGLYECYYGIIELLFPIPFLNLAAPILAIADLGQDILLTLVKGIKSLALDNACLNPRFVTGTALDANGTPVQVRIGDSCPTPAVLDDNNMCCPSIDNIAGNGLCNVPTTRPGICSPDSDNFSYFTRPINMPGGIDPSTLQTPPATDYPYPLAWQTGPVTEICDPTDPDGQGPLTGEVGVLCNDCCKEGQTQFECDIERMSDETIVIVVSLCDIIRAVLPIPGLDLCCSIEALLVALIELILMDIQILVNLGTINTAGLDYFRIVPPPTALSPGDPGYVEPGTLDNVGLIKQFDIFIDAIFGTPGGRCARVVPGTGIGGSPPQFSGGEAVGGGVTCFCQVLNWIIPARKYPALPVGVCPENDPGCDNCPLIDLCCWFREPGFVIAGIAKFMMRFVTTFWQEWIAGRPQVVIDFLFCDEYREWDPTMGTSVPSGNIWPATDNNIGAQPSELLTPSCGQIDPILRGIQAILSECPCTVLKYVDALLALIFAVDPASSEAACLCGPEGLFKTIPELVYFIARRAIQFFRMFWSKDFWNSPDGPPIVSAGRVNDMNVLGPVSYLNLRNCTDLDPGIMVPPGYSGLCLALQDGTVIFGEDYQNQTWARWFLMPIATKICQSILAVLCIPDLILGAIFGCTNTRAQLVASLIIWPTEFIIVALEFVEGIANTFAGNCGGVQYGGTGGPLGSVNTACIGGAITGLFKFPLNLLIADGLLAQCPPEEISDFLRELLSELPTCNTASVQTVSGMLIAGLRYTACLLNRFTGGSSASNTIDSAAGKAILALAGFLSVIWQLSSKLAAVFATFINLAISIIGFSSGDLCSCHEPWFEWYDPSHPNFAGSVNPNSAPRWRQGEGFGVGLCYPCMIDAQVDCGGLSGNIPGTYYNPLTDTITPGPLGCPDPNYFATGGAAPTCGACVNWVNRSDLVNASATFLPPDGYSFAKFQCYWEQPASRAKPLCSFLGLIEGFFNFVGSIFDIFNPLPKFPPDTLVSSARRRRTANAPNASDVHQARRSRQWNEAHAKKSEVRDEVRHFHARAQAERNHRSLYRMNDTLGILAEAFVGYDTSDCGVDPVNCLCRNLHPIMEGLCDYDFETMQVISLKPGGAPVTPDEVIARLGEDCSSGNSPCDQLITDCGYAPWSDLANNPALRHLWVQCVDLYVAGERVHAVDERFPSDFFNSHTGVLDLMKNVHESANLFAGRMEEEAREHQERLEQRQRAENVGGLTDLEYDRLYLKRALFTYTQEHGSPRFPGIAASMLRLDLKLHKLRNGHMGRLLHKAAKNVMSGDWKMPPYAAAHQHWEAWKDVTHFVVRGINYREGVSSALRHAADTWVEADEMLRSTVRRVVDHGITGEHGLLGHWKRQYHRKRYGTDSPRTVEDAMQSFWGAFAKDPLVSAFYNGPAYQWWTSSWNTNVNVFRPFIEHVQRVRRVYQNTPAHLLEEHNPAARTSPSRIYANIRNPWTEFKKFMSLRWAPRWDWRLRDWPEDKETPDRWENIRTMGSVGLAAYEVVYPGTLEPETKKRWLVGPGANCSLIADTVALIFDVFDYCATEYTFNLPVPDCINNTNPNVGCSSRRRTDLPPGHFVAEGTASDVMPLHGNTTLARYLRRNARHRNGFLRDRTSEWSKHHGQTKMVWQKWNQEDPHSYIRPRIVHTPDPSRARNLHHIHPHHWRQVMRFFTTGVDLYARVFMEIVKVFTSVPMPPELAEFFMDLRDWIENDNINPDACGLPGSDGVGLRYWALFPLRCEFPDYVNCSNACGLGLRTALKRVALISIIVFGGLSTLLPFVLAPLTAVSAVVFYLFLIPAVAWHYSPACALITPGIPIPGLGITVPALPFLMGFPLLPECFVDDIKSILDEFFGPCPWSNFRGLVPLCLYNSDACPACPERIDLANCMNVGVADGISNLAYAFYWVWPQGADFIDMTLSTTCFFGGCFSDIFPFNLRYLTDKFAEFRTDSDTQQCRQKWCFWATILSISLPLLGVVVFGALIFTLFVAVVGILVAALRLIVRPLNFLTPGAGKRYFEAPGDEVYTSQPLQYPQQAQEEVGQFMPIGNGYFVNVAQQQQQLSRRRHQERIASRIDAYRRAQQQQVGIGDFINEIGRPILNLFRRMRTPRKQKRD